MDKERAIYFAGLMEEYLNIPSCVCENIENELINEKYYKVINYVINRRKELENKVNYKTYREITNMYLDLQNRIEKAIEYIKIYRSYQKNDNKDYLKRRDEIGCLDICQVDELLDILKEVE